MPVTKIPMSKSVSVVLDIGNDKVKSVSIGELRTNADNDGCFAVATAVSGIYDENVNRVQGTEKYELADS